MEMMEEMDDGGGDGTSPSPPPPRLVRVKMEMEYPTNSDSLELQMEAVQEDFEEGQDAGNGEDDGSLDEFPPLLYPESSSGMQNGYHNMSMDENYMRMEHQQLPQQDEGSVWYRCKHCSILLEDVMTFLFHIRLHEDSSVAGGGDLGMDTPSLEKELTEAGVTIFSPLILTPKIPAEAEVNFGNAVTRSIPPLPRLTRAPSSSSLTASNQLPGNSFLEEHLPRKCKLCIPHLHFGRRQEFIDHLFQKHRQDREFRCSKVGCRYKTRSVQFIESHMENHPVPYSRIYTCHLCIPKTKWYQSTRYAQHMRSHLGKDGKYRCLYCPYNSTGLQLLNKHSKKRHPETGGGEVDVSGSRGPNPYRALPSSIVPQRQQTRVVKHKVDGRGKGQIGRQFLCYFCSKAWLSRKQYESHMILHHRNTRRGYSCHQCNYEADSIRIIARHFKYKHDGDSIRKVLTKGVDKEEVAGTNDDMVIESDEGEDEEDYDIEDEFGPDEEEEEAGDHVQVLPPPKPSGIMSKTPLVLSSPSSLTLTGGSSPPPLSLVKTEVTCPFCRDLPPLGNINKYFDHIFQKHCRDNAVYCPQCPFRSTSLDTTIQHTVTAHPPMTQKSQEQPKQAKPPTPLKSTMSTMSTTPMPKSVSNYGSGKLNYLCRFCMSSWSEVLAYSAHMKQHLDGHGHYRCPYCQLPYPTLNRFNEHVKRRHEMLGQVPPQVYTPAPSQEQPRQSLTPPTQFAVSRRLSSLASSSQRRGGGGGGRQMKKSYACFYCTPQGLNFTSVKAYSRHMRELHMSGDGLYACPSCPTIRPTTLKKINEHLKRKSHTLQAQGSGDGEGEGSTELGRTRGGGPVPDQLPTQNEPVKEEPVVKQEVETTRGKTNTTFTTVQKWFQCKACFILVESKEKLIIHQRTHMTPHPVENGLIENPKPTRFDDETDYRRKADEARPPILPNLPLQMPLHKCKLCSPPSWHRSMGKLEEHVKESHSGGGGQPNGGQGPSPPTMRRRPCPRSRAQPGAHADVPPKEKPSGGRTMTCLFCFTVFSKQSTYITHMKEEHTDESGSFSCPNCPNYSTPLLSRATKHIRRHTRPDPQPPLPRLAVGGVKKRRKGKLRRVGRGGANGRRGGGPVPLRTTTVGTIQFKGEPS